MRQIEVGGKLYGVVAAGIFLFATILHGLRAYYGWELVYNGWMVPVSISWLATVIAFVMAITAIRRLY